MVVDTAVEGNNEDVALVNWKPTGADVGAPNVVALVEFPKRFGRGVVVPELFRCPKIFDVGAPEVVAVLVELPKRLGNGELEPDLLRLPKILDVGAFVGVASVTLTVGLALLLGVGVVLANRIGLFGDHVWSVGAAGALGLVALGCVFSLSSVGS